MATTKDLYQNRVVTTQYGTAIITMVDKETSFVRVKHLKSNTPVTDFRFSEIKLTSNTMRIIPQTKSNYLNLNGISLDVKEYLPNKTHTGRITCSVVHPDLLKVVDVDFNENEVEIIEKRGDGFYWVKSTLESQWEISKYLSATKQFSYTDGKHNYESEMYLIDETPIKRD